ncbi:MAG: signal peptidase I [Anaerolineae bacterium]|nr:signal peptidase I [Thermoflexus sp.]MDW8064862.1 signal peptidase I [Anaerolineae bacterium]
MDEHPVGFPIEQVELPSGQARERVAHRWLSFLRELVETVLIVIVVMVLVNTVTARFQIEGSSMEPNLRDGEYVLISKISYWFGSPQRGDVVVFRFPHDPHRDFIKRIIGLPGETVAIRDGKVFIDGRPLEETYIRSPIIYTYGPVTLGPDEYFVLGDNRNASNDSHNWGTLPYSAIIGEAWLVYWPPSRWRLIRNPFEGDTP